MKKYIVREGDTMWEISKATGVRLNLLMAANPQVKDPNQLRPGSLIVVPELGKHDSSATQWATILHSNLGLVVSLLLQRLGCNRPNRPPLRQK